MWIFPRNLGKCHYSLRDMVTKLRAICNSSYRWNHLLSVGFFDPPSKISAPWICIHLWTRAIFPSGTLSHSHLFTSSHRHHGSLSSSIHQYACIVIASDDGRNIVYIYLIFYLFVFVSWPRRGLGAEESMTINKKRKPGSLARVRTALLMGTEARGHTVKEMEPPRVIPKYVKNFPALFE
jgi:hypothetical protein